MSRLTESVWRGIHQCIGGLICAERLYEGADSRRADGSSGS